MIGLQFYWKLRYVLQAEQAVSPDDSYTFVGWDEKGKLRYRINHSQTLQIKKIEPEILIMAAHWRSKNIHIDHPFLQSNGHNNWCTPPVLNFLLDNYLDG